MSETIELTKEACLEAVGQVRSKEELKEQFPEIAKHIKESKWFYMLKPDNYAKEVAQTGAPPALPEREAKPFRPPLAKKAEPKAVDKTYQYTEHQNPSFNLNVGYRGDLIVFDEKTNEERAIRHCPNTRTIWVDEQNKDIAVIKPIEFVDGFLDVPAKQEYTQRFIEAHPHFGTRIILVDEAADASKIVKSADLRLDIKMAIRKRMEEVEGGIEEVRAIVSALTSDPAGAAKMQPPEIRHAAYEQVDSNPNRFVDDKGNVTIFDDEAIQRRALAEHAFLSGVVAVAPNGRQVQWADNGAAICNVPTGLNYKDVFVEFLGTELGIDVAQELSRR